MGLPEPRNMTQPARRRHARHGGGETQLAQDGRREAEMSRFCRLLGCLGGRRRGFRRDLTMRYSSKG